MKTVTRIFCLIYLVGLMTAVQSQTIDLSENWKFKPEPAGEKVDWQAPHFDDTDWSSVKAGVRWEDQGFPDVDGYAWYRRKVDVPQDWANQPVWLIFGALNDAFVLYCNGQRVNLFGDESRQSVANIPAMANLAPFLQPGRTNMVALRVFDWGGSGGPWREPALLTIDPAVIKQFPVLFCSPDFEQNRLAVSLNLTLLGRKWQNSRIQISLIESGSNQILLRKSRHLTDAPGVVQEQFELPDTVSSYRIHARLALPGGAVIFDRTRTIDWKRPDEKKSRLKILNNFVTELLHQSIAAEAPGRIEFENPRNGWVYFALGGHSVSVPALLDQQIALKWRLNPATQIPEAMLYLSEGTHTLQISGLTSGELIIRAIPEIIYSQHPGQPHIEPFGPYDWDFLSRHVLSHVNTIVTGGIPEEFDSWQAEGRKWLVHASLPGLNDPAQISGTYATWAVNPGVIQPGFGGIIVDEFMLVSREHYQPWTEAVLKLYQNPAFSGKHFYAYCNDLFQNPYLPAFEFSQKLLQQGGRFALERYLPLPATEADAQALIQEELQHAVLAGNHQLPGLKEHLVICLGYLSDPPETLNRLPHVNYKVFMDMQFHFLATNPAFRGLFGIQEYLSSYADEEVLRWAHRLFRHYCIEGRRERYSNEPFILPHLENPDFVAGLRAWHAEPANPGSIQPDTLPGFSWLQGRYPEIETGNQGARFRRSDERPNRLRQTLKALKPGQWYSLKLISADMNHLDQKQRLGLFVDIEDVVFASDRCFQHVYPSSYAHSFGPYNVDHRAWLNYHRLVFRAEKETAELIISDWPNPVEPGGPAGQQIIFNFVEVKPYLWEESAVRY